MMRIDAAWRTIRGPSCYSRHVLLYKEPLQTGGGTNSPLIALNTFTENFTISGSSASAREVAAGHYSGAGGRTKRIANWKAKVAATQ